jgi:hypothetical protein
MRIINSIIKKIAFTEQLDETIETNTEQFIAKLENHLNSKNQIFQGRPLSGKLIGTRFEFEINPPLLWANPFKSKVCGQIFYINHQNHLHCKIYPNLRVKIFLGIIILLFILRIEQFNLFDFKTSPITVISVLIITIICIAVVKAKVKMDTMRFKNILKKIKNNSNNI